MYRRRTLLRAGAAATVLTVAGCSQQSGSTPTSDGSDDEETTTDGTATTTDTEEQFDDRPGEQAGDGTSEQVTNRLNVVSEVGLVDGGTVSAVELVVAPAPGADSIDLRDVTVQWIDGTGTYGVVAASSDSTESGVDGTFATATIKDSDDSAPVLNDPSDRLQLRLDLGGDDVSGAEGFGESLEPGAEATVRIVTASGASTIAQLTVPKSLSDARAVAL